MLLAAAILLCFASGFLLLRLGWPLKTSSIASALFQCSVSAGFGLGVFSVIYFVSRAAGIQHLLLVDVGVFLALLVAFLVIRSRPAVGLQPTHAFTSIPLWLERAIVIGFVLSLAAALYSAVTRTLAYPHGDGWDAFSIWNLRARFLFLAGERWRDTFSPLIPWSHPDYPLLLPASTAHFWTLLGRDDPRVPAAIALLFTFTTVGLLFSTLHILRGRTSAMLGSITLLATPAFIEQGTAQYADVPVSFFFLATIAFLSLSEETPGNRSGLICLAGLGAAFSAWTKNEGLLFFATLLAAQICVTVQHRCKFSTGPASPWSCLALFLAGALPILLVLLYFKRNIAGPGDLFADSSSVVQKLLTPARYWAVLQWFVKDFFRFGRWLLIPGTLLLAGFYFVLKNRSAKPSNAARISTLALLLTLAGYAMIYLITPRDLYWHLRFSSDRLFLQLWPSTIFLFFLRM